MNVFTSQHFEDLAELLRQSNITVAAMEVVHDVTQSQEQIRSLQVGCRLVPCLRALVLWVHPAAALLETTASAPDSAQASFAPRMFWQKGGLAALYTSKNVNVRKLFLFLGDVTTLDLFPAPVWRRHVRTYFTYAEKVGFKQHNFLTFTFTYVLLANKEFFCKFRVNVDVNVNVGELCRKISSS